VEELKTTSGNNRNIEILSNSSEIQAVKHNQLQIYQVAFYKSGELEIAKDFKVRIDSQGMAMLKMDGNKVKELTVSDPSRKLSRILITVPGIYNSKGENFMTFVNSSKNSTLVVVDLPLGVYLGKSVTIRL